MVPCVGLRDDARSILCQAGHSIGLRRLLVILLLSNSFGESLFHLEEELDLLLVPSVSVEIGELIG